MAAASSTSSRSRRLLGAAGLVLMAAAVVCAAFAVAIVRSDAPADSFAPARLAVTPSTIPPRPVPAPPSAPARVAARSSVESPPSPSPPAIEPDDEASTAASPPPAPSTSLPLSPLNSLVGEAVSARPTPPVSDVAPASIAIDAIGLPATPVRAVGVAADGQLEVPDETEVGWYRLGAAPGQPGATVLAAHVSWRDQAGQFLRLGELEPGALVDVALADGTDRRYQVVARDQYGKLMLPREEIWRTSGPETLVLITCGGAFNPDLRRYADNIVVTAVPVA